MQFRLLLTFIIYISYPINLKSEENIIVKHIYPPKCTMLEDSKTLLCPRIMELAIEIKHETKKKLINCLLLSEEGEILAPEGMHSIEMEGQAIVLTVDGNGIVTEIAETPEEEVAPVEEVTPEAVAEVVEELQSAFAKEIETLKSQNEVFAKQIETLVGELDNENKRKFNTTPKSKKTWREFTK